MGRNQNPNQPKNYNDNTVENESLSRGGSSKKLNHLAKIAGPSYSISGYAPTTAIWKLNEDQVKSIVSRIARGFLNDIKYVTIDTNHKNGNLNILIWLPIQSSNLKDNTMLDGNSAIKRPLTRYSPALKEFMQKFCAEDKRRTVNEDSGKPYVGIEVQLEKFLNIEFDVKGEQYSREYGGSKLRCSIRLTSFYSKSDAGYFGRFRYLQVEKSLKGEYESDPKPRRSYNAH